MNNKRITPSTALGQSVFCNSAGVICQSAATIHGLLKEASSSATRASNPAFCNVRPSYDSHSTRELEKKLTYGQVELTKSELR